MALPSSTYDTATLVNPDSNLTDFTLVVDLSRMSAAWWSAVDTSDGTKGRAAKDSGPTEVPCDWIDFDNVNQTGLLRVKWSGTLLTGATTQTLRIYPPQAANASVAASDTYGSDNAYDSDWAAYWPLHDEFDRTVNNHHLTPVGGVTLGTAIGKLGAATSFDGSNDRLDYTSGAVTTGGSEVTWMAWIYPNTISSVQSVFYQRQQNNSIYERCGILATYIRSSEYNGSASIGSINYTQPSASKWNFIAFERTPMSNDFGPFNQRRIWVGKTKSNYTSSNLTGTDVVDSTYIGGASYGGELVNGLLNQVQMHSINRPTNWTEYEHDQINNQAAFWGTWTNVPGSPAVTTKAYWWG